MRNALIGIIAIAFILESSPPANAQKLDNGKVLKKIEAIVPDLKSPWLLDSTNSQIVYLSANQYSVERTFLSDGRTITIKATSADQDVEDMRAVLGSIEPVLVKATNHTIIAEGEDKEMLWSFHPDWILTQTSAGQSFKIGGVHRTEPITFLVEGNQVDILVVSNALEKKLKKFPKSSR
jgi:hypothetical protein